MNTNDVSDKIQEVLNNFSKKHDGLVPRFEIIKWNGDEDGDEEEWIIRLTDGEWIFEEVVGESLEEAFKMIDEEI